MFKYNFILRVRHHYFLSKLISGLLLIAGGAAGFLPGNAGIIWQGISFAAALLLNNAIYYSRKEKLDEMAEQNISRAKAISADFMQLILFAGVFIAYVLRNSVQINWSVTLTWLCVMLIGVMDIIQAVAFKRLEDK